jgi:hypothetical protein
VVQNNTGLLDGGGILVQGNSRLFMLSDQTVVTYNHALGSENPTTHAITGGYGGGIALYARRVPTSALPDTALWA